MNSIFSTTYFALIALLLLAGACELKDRSKKIESLSGCEQFEAIFPGCWCVGNPDPVLFIGKIEAGTESQAMMVVEEYFRAYPAKRSEFHHSADLGYGWFNLFYGHLGDKVFTLGPKGKIYRTECGV